MVNEDINKLGWIYRNSASYLQVILKLCTWWDWCTLSSVTGSGHVRYMASPFFDLYMTTCHVSSQLTCHVQVT